MNCKMVGALIFCYCFGAGSGLLYAATLLVTSVADDGPGSLRFAVNDAQSTDTIRFSSALNYVPLKLNSPIIVTKSLMFWGNGTDKTILDGQGTTQLLWINAAQQDVKFIHLSLINGFSPLRGGGMELVKGNVVLGYVNIDHCIAHTDTPRTGGGAIYNGDSLIVEKCKFRHNQALGTRGAGGALLSSGDFGIKTTNLTIQDCVAATSGGGLQEYGNSSSYSYYYKTRIYDSQAEEDGGGVHFQGLGRRTLSTSWVERNRAGGSGGAIVVTEGDLKIAGTNMKDNEAVRAGGALSISDGYVFVDHSTLENNNVSLNKGVGGGIVVHPLGELNLNRSKIRYNSAADGGGIACLSSTESALIVKGSTLQANTANGPSGRGGGIFSKSDGIVNVYMSTIDSNVAIRAGGGLWLFGGKFQSSRSIYSNNKVDGKTGQGSGGALWTDSVDISMRTPRFVKNSVIGENGRGGAMYLRNGTLKSIALGYFIDNSCSDRGGAIDFANGSLDMSEVEFAHNSAIGPLGLGGAVYIERSNLKLHRNKIVFNSVNYRGGGLYAGPYTTTQLTNCTIADNIVYGYIRHDTLQMAGGGVFDEGTHMSLYRVSMYNNTVLGSETENGGAIASIAPSEKSYTFSTISGNTVTGVGGGIAEAGVARVENATIIFNQAFRGGGIAQLAGDTRFKGVAVSDNYGSAGNRDVHAQGGALQSEGYNLFGSDPVHTILKRSTDLHSRSGKFAILKNNEGKYTPTHMPLPGSPVINKGFPSTSGKYRDQIGQAPAGGQREIAAVLTIG